MEIIQAGEPLADFVGFDHQLFDGEMIIDVSGQIAIITIITSLDPGKGNFNKLLNKLFSKFEYIQVWNPYKTMQEILSRKGFYRLNNSNALDIWEKSNHELCPRPLEYPSRN